MNAFLNKSNNFQKQINCERRIIRNSLPKYCCQLPQNFSFIYYCRNRPLKVVINRFSLLICQRHGLSLDYLERGRARTSRLLLSQILNLFCYIPRFILEICIFTSTAVPFFRSVPKRKMEFTMIILWADKQSQFH